MSLFDSPDPPSATETARAQSAINRDTAIAQQQLNAVNQITPYGNLQYSQNGYWDDKQELPRMTATQTLTPEQQLQLDLGNAAGIQYGDIANTQLSAIGGTLRQPLDFSDLGPAPEFNQGYMDQTAQNMYARQEPWLQDSRQQLEAQLANEGFMRGSAAYDDEMFRQQQRENDLRLAIDNAALGQAGQMYGLESNAYDRGANQLIQERSIPLNELAAMLSGTAVQNPQFINAPQIGMQAPDFSGMQYANYQSDLNQNNALLGGLFGLGGAALGGFAQNGFSF